MRASGRMALGLCFCLSLVASSARADEQTEGAAIIDKAVKAAGGAEKLARLKSCTFKAKGAGDENGKKIEVTMEGSLDGLDRYRMDMEANNDGRQNSGTLVINGDQGWFHDKQRARTEDAPPGVQPVVKSLFTNLRAAQLLPLLKEKDIALAPLGELPVDGKAAVGLRITPKGQTEFSMFFDKETHLPVRSEILLKGPMEMEVKVECLFSDFKELGGAKHFGKVVMKFEIMGRPVAFELEVTEVKAQEKFEEAVFAKPS